MGSGRSRISRTKHVGVKPASCCPEPGWPEHSGWLVLSSLPFQCSCKWSSGHGRSCCHANRWHRSTSAAYFSRGCYKTLSYSWEKWQIPGKQLFLLAQLVTKKDAVWECRDSLEILPHIEKFVSQEIKAKCRVCPKWKLSQAEICLIPGILDGAEPSILYLITLSLKWFVKLPWGISAMRSRDETLCSQRQILLLIEYLEWKPLNCNGVVSPYFTVDTYSIFTVGKWW